MVCGVPRPCGVLQRAVRSAHQGADRHARGAGRAGVHVVPRDHEREEHHGPGRLHGGVSADARSRRERASGVAVCARQAARARSAAAQRNLYQAVSPGTNPRVLLELPQGPPRHPRQWVSLVPRLQRLRQLAGVGHLGRGGTIVLLPAGAAKMRGLPHAARELHRPGRQERAGPIASVCGGQHGVAVRESRHDAAARGPGLSPAMAS